VPLILRLPQGSGALMRTQELIQPGDLHDLLLAQVIHETPSLLRDIVEGRDQPPRDIACAVAKGERAIRTPAWFLREVGTSGDEPKVELFAKSDDRWEVNEVASRAAEVVDNLKAALNAFEQAAREGRLPELSPLAEALSDQWR